MSKWKVSSPYGLLLIFMICFSLNSGIDYDYEDQKAADSWGRCPWIRNRVKNGRVRIRSRGRIAKFSCKAGYELVGRKFATCVRGQWNNPIPVCIAKGCPRITAIANGIVTEKYKGAQLTFGCNPGYNLSGDPSLFCDGSQWGSSPPTCQPATLQPQTYCDFEDPDLCGWKHDPSHDFDWRRNQFKTPSGHVGTGPSYDHTFGKGKAGYYMYEEASAPRNENDTSRLFSPVYFSNDSPGCFVFWYHMYGATIGRLRIYVKPESHVFVELTPSWEKSGDQGNQWLRGNVTIPPLSENFQIVVEGVRGSSYVGDTAIDDVNLLKSNCSATDSSNTTEMEEASADSCRGRCHEPDNSTSCGCTDSCESDNTCCSDYAKLCAEGSEPPNVIDESVSGKPETDATPEDNVGTDYTVAPSIPATEFTRSENEPTVTENKKQPPSIQVATPNTTAPTTLTTVVNTNITAGTTATVPPPTVPDEHVSVTRKNNETSNLPTQGTISISSTEKPTMKTTTAISLLSISTMKAETTATQAPVATTVEEPIISSIPVTSLKTVPTTSSIASSTSTVTVSNKPVVVPSFAASTSQPTATAPTTESTKSTSVTTLTSTTKTTTEMIPTTGSSVPPVVTVLPTLKMSTNMPRSTVTTTPEVATTTSSTSTTSTTGIPAPTTVMNTKTTNRIFRASTSERIIPITSSAVRSTTVKTSTIPTTARTYRYRPTVRRTTASPVISTTFSTYFRRPRTTKATTNVVSLFFSAKGQTTTPDSLRDGTHALKSETVASAGNSSSVIGASVGVIIIACLIGGVTFVFLRRRRQKLNKLHDDSIRFLPDNEVIEYSEASVGDPLFET